VRWRTRDDMAATQELGRALTATLETRAPRYFHSNSTAADRQPRASATLPVTLTGVRERRFSTLFDFEVAAQALVVKAPSGRRHRALAQDSGETALPDSLRLTPRVRPEQKGVREFRALRAIQEHFDALADRRFGCVRVLDYLPEFGALCMERVPAESLARYLAGARRAGPRAELPAAAAQGFRNAGTWLRIFHAAPGLEHTRTRHERREDLRASLLRFLDYLDSHGQRPELLSELRSALPAAVESRLPPLLPTGLCHGDFAPHNLLCDASGRITALDTQAAWRAPIYEDLAHFAVSLDGPALFLLTDGRPPQRSDQCRVLRELLAGYFGDEKLPRAALALFEIQARLARWAALVHHADAAQGLRRAAKRGRLALISRGIASRIAACTRELRA